MQNNILFSIIYVNSNAMPDAALAPGAPFTNMV